MNRWGLLFLVSSVVAITVAYVAEFFFGLLPCKLCLYERIPYFIALPLSVVSLFTKDRYSFFSVTLCYICGATISMYHAGLEYGWFEDILHCAGEVNSSQTLSDIKSALLRESVIPSCSRPSFIFLGLSFSGWNALYSAICVMLAVILRKRPSVA